MNSNTDYSILYAAHALMSLAPPLQPKGNDVRHHPSQHSTASTMGSYYDFQHHDTNTATASMVDELHYITATPSSFSNSDHHYSYSTFTPTAVTTGYPRILNVPQPRPGSTTSCASSLDDGLDNHSQSSLTTTGTGVQLQQPNTLPRASSNTKNRKHENDTTTIVYRPQEITSYDVDTCTAMLVDRDTVGISKMATSNTVKKYQTKKDTSKSSKKHTSTKKQGSSSGISKNSTSAITPITAASTYYEGSVSLRLKEDEFSLSPLHCFMRQFCVEAFTASSEEVTTPRYGKSHGRSISIGQVGIQCVYCKHRPYWLRQERAVCFPSTLKNIYHSIETWQRRHSIVCTDIPLWAKDKMTKLMGKSRSGAGGRRQYWEESAAQLGMVDTPTGIRFIRPPGTATTLTRTSTTDYNQIPFDYDSRDSIDGTASTVSTDEEMTKISTNTPTVTASNSMVDVETFSSNLKDSSCIRGKAVVHDEDRELVTEFLFTLLNQMETCYFSEQDRIGGRSKVKDCPAGYPGLQCKHCGGKAGFGRYYPISIQALTSANSDRNIYNHVEKCRRCPSHIREQLEQHLNDQIIAKNRRGNRKEFFQRIWKRMHGATVENKSKTIANECSDDRVDLNHHKELFQTQNSSFRHHQKQLLPQYWHPTSSDSNGPMVITSNNSGMGQHQHPQHRQHQHQHQQHQQHQLEQQIKYQKPNIFYTPFNNLSEQQGPPQSKLYPRQQILQQLQQRFQERPESWQRQQQQPHHSIDNALPFYARHNHHQF